MINQIKVQSINKNNYVRDMSLNIRLLNGGFGADASAPLTTLHSNSTSFRSGRIITVKRFVPPLGYLII